VYRNHFAFLSTRSNGLRRPAPPGSAQDAPATLFKGTESLAEATVMGANSANSYSIQMELRARLGRLRMAVAF